MKFLTHRIVAPVVLAAGLASLFFLFSPVGFASMVRVIQVVMGPSVAVWTQTDWVGGAGQPIWSDPTKYDSDNGNIDTRTTGQTTLGATAATPWVSPGGAVVTDTTDTDFDAGTFSNTVRVATSSAASIILAQGAVWGADAGSGVATTQIIRGVKAISDTNIWAVGDSGKILHYDGASWSEFADVGAANLYAIDGLSANDVWTAGTSGKVYHYNGTSWTEVLDAGSMTWRALRMVSAADGWLAGTSGKLFRWNGVSWSEFTDTGNQTWAALAFVSGADGWVAGSSGQIYRWNGTTWALHTDTGGQTWNALAFLSSSDGWAAGSGGEIYRWNGASWAIQTDTGGQTWNALAFVSSSDGWVAGSAGNIYHWNGSVWSLHTTTGTQTWNALAFLSSSNGWVFGNAGAIYSYGPAYLSSGTFVSRVFDGGSSTTTWNALSWVPVLPAGSSITIATRTGNTAVPDGTWSAFSAELTQSGTSDITSPAGRYFQYRATLTRGTNGYETPEMQSVSIVLNSPVTVQLFDIEAISASNVWTVGGSGKIYRYNGSAWSEFADMGTLAINSISSVSASDIWAAGISGKIYHYNGSVWSEFADTGAQTWNTIAMTGAIDGWLAGSGGEIYRWNGTAWAIHTDTGNQTWNALSLISPSDGWIVGSAGEIYRWNGVAWSSFVDVGAISLNDIQMISSTDGWIVGSAGKIYRYNGTSWAQHTDTGNHTWNGVAFSSPSEGWVAGNGGNILIWRGSAFAFGTSNVIDDLFAADTFGALEAWVSGDVNILHLLVTGGFLTSSAFDMTNASPLENISWTESIPACSPACDITLQLRTATDAGGSPGIWTEWYGAGGAGDYFINPSGTNPPAGLDGNRFMQYRAHMIGDGSSTPALLDVDVDYQ